MKNVNTPMHDNGWRSAGSRLILRKSHASRLAISADGKPGYGIIEDLTVPDVGRARFLPGSTGLFESYPTMELDSPVGALAMLPPEQGRPYAYRWENAYVRVCMTSHEFLPTLLIEFKPYALLTLDPVGLEAMRETICERFLLTQGRVRISRLGIAVDFRCLGLKPPTESEVFTRARTRKAARLPHLESPTFGSPNGGITFGIYHHTASASANEEWLDRARRSIEGSSGGFAVWRAEFTYYRPAIRRLALDEGGAGCVTEIETIPELASLAPQLLSQTLDARDPWIRVIQKGYLATADPEAPSVWWWNPLREVFLEDTASLVSGLKPTVANGGGTPGRLARLLSKVTPNRTLLPR